jgi:hypothetical protein
VNLALAAAQALGNTLRDVALTVLTGRLGPDCTIGTATEVLLAAVLANVTALHAATLDLVDRLSADETSLVALAPAAQALSELRRFGIATLPNRQLLEALADRLYVRACYAITGASDCAAEIVPQVAEALRTLVAIAASDPNVKSELLPRQLSGLIDSIIPVHPRLRGIGLGLLLTLPQAPALPLAQVLREQLEPPTEPQHSTEFIGGLLESATMQVVASPVIVGAVTSFLVALAEPDFIAVLPGFRRAFADLNPGERRRLVGTIGQLLTPATTEPSPDPSAQSDHLAEIDQALDDLLGPLA